MSAHDLLEAEERVSGLPLNVHSNGLASSISVKPGQGGLYGFVVMNTNASSQYIQLFDARKLPSDGAVPVATFIVEGTTNLSLGWLPARRFEYGCVICNSSTAATKTLGSGDCFFDVQYI